MSTRRVPVNAAALLLGRIFGAVVAVVVASIAAHRLTIEEFGLMASTMAAGFLVNTLVTFGTDTVVTRAVAADRSDAGAVTRASLLVQVVAAAAFAGAAAIAVGAGVDVAVLVQALALIPMAIVTVSGAVLRGRQRMDLLLVATVAGALCTLAAVLIGFAIRESTWVPIAALGVGSAVTAVVSGWFARSGLATAGSTSTSILALVRETAPFAAMVVLAAVGAQAGLLLVEFATQETAGGYGVAVRLSEAARLVPAAAMGAFFPAMLSGLHRTAQYQRWMRWLLSYAVAATIALLALAEPINRLVFDSQPGGTALIRIVSLGLVITVVRLALSFEFIADGRERVVLHSAVVGAAITVIGGLAVATRFGSTGIAWMQLAGLFAAVALLAFNRTKSTEPAAAPLV